MTKKIVALLLVIATLCLPFCGLADDIPKTVDGIAEWLLSGDIDWIPMDVEINESLNDWLVIGWLSEYKQRCTRGYKRYKETSGLIEWKECQIFHSIFT